MTKNKTSEDIVNISPVKYLTGCILLSILILTLSSIYTFPSWVIVTEVFITVIALFIFGSIRYRIDKNILTYGAAIPITVTFSAIWWPSSGLRTAVQEKGIPAWGDFTAKHLVTFKGLDELIHLDTMLFILGLTFFISAISQTRLLETVSFSVLKKNKGNVFSTIAFLLAIISISSGIMDGVSMIGLLIRTMVIILTISKADEDTIIYAVMISTIITTVCGMWLAYGEPPNLIMKANLFPYLDDLFFINYCLPLAVGSYFIVIWNIQRRLKQKNIEIDKLDIIDAHTADVRFLQSLRHGEVLGYLEFIHDHKDTLGEYFQPLLRRIQEGMPLGEAMVRENIPAGKRKRLIGIFLSEDMAETVDKHYLHLVSEDRSNADEAAVEIRYILEKEIKSERIRAQRIAVISFIPFIAMLIWHAVDHHIPLFNASFAGFAVAIFGIASKSKMRDTALRDGWHEFSEYLFLIPLFFSITLVQKTGFFDQLGRLMHWGITAIGTSHVAFSQFTGSVLLSAILDNNVVADFAGKVLKGLEINLMHLFAMSQIAGYALGGCATHIGSAQSVVAYSFIKKDIKEGFTPIEWIKKIFPILLEIFIFMAVIIYIRGWILT